MTKQQNDPAFPVCDQSTLYYGMMLRDYFAGQVIGAIYTRSSHNCTNEDDARNAYKLADAMLAERLAELAVQP
jgi:hypothetical protein